MNVLLTTLNAKYIHTNLAIRLLYQLNKQHEGLQWKEFTIKEDQDRVAVFCSSFDVVAFSCYIWNITQTLGVAAKIKSLNPNIKILLGGPEVSYEYENVIALPEVDYIIAGEGEIPFSEFLLSFPNVQHVPGLVSKDNGKVTVNPPPPVFDTKQLEHIMPYESDTPEELANKVLYLETSRGCPYKCEFCLASLDNKVRYLPDATIKATLRHMMQHGRVIKFLDRTFNIKRDFTLDIFKFILAHHRPGNVFQFEITADILHPDIIHFINEHVPKNLFRFEIGIQTVNQQANLEVSRKQNFEKTKAIIRSLQHKVEMHLDLIVGLPLDYWADIKNSFEEVFKLFAPELQLGFLKFLKGTPVRDKHNKHGFVFQKNPPYQIIQSNYLSQEELDKITRLEHALEIYWNSGKALNTLKYITPLYGSFDFLSGLGIHFGKFHSYHHYSFDDVFNVLWSYCSEHYPNDGLLRQFIALDYYLHFKVKPKAFSFLPEFSREEKNRVLSEAGIHDNKARYIVLPLEFNPSNFIIDNTLNKGDFFAILQYNGREKAKLVNVIHRHVSEAETLLT